jgi:hypothetical protein
MFHSRHDRVWMCVWTIPPGRRRQLFHTIQLPSARSTLNSSSGSSLFFGAVHRNPKQQLTKLAESCKKRSAGPRRLKSARTSVMHAFLRLGDRVRSFAKRVADDRRVHPSGWSNAS